jgi:predicted dehydrogenase
MVKCRQAMPTELTLAGIYDIRPNRARQASDQHQLAQVYPSYEAMLNDPQLDLIVIGTPDHLHGEQAIQALEAGKHVLSEIPAAYEIDQLRRLVQLEEQTGLKYAMGNEVRWFPYLEAAKRMATDGYWGDLFYSEAGYLHNLRLENWKQTEPETNEPHWRFDPARPQTTFLGGGPHAFDTIRWLIGETNWTDVIAYGAAPYVPPHPEPGHAVALLRNADGQTCKIETSYVMNRP